MRNNVNFNTDWRFAKTGEIPGTLPENWERVTLPHTWNAIDGQDGGNSSCYSIRDTIGALQANPQSVKQLNAALQKIKKIRRTFP